VKENDDDFLKGKVKACLWAKR